MKSESASNGLCGLRASPSAGHVTEVVATNSLLQEKCSVFSSTEAAPALITKTR